jgi:copper oxidase (laccase) domain-containing protein
MHKKGATEIHALIGPSIQQTSYEVDDNFYHNFLSTSTLCKDLFIPSKDPGKHLFNLPQYVRRQLERENVCIAKHIEEDTYQNPNQYHSYRRDCHTDQQNGPVNMLSTIIIR